MLMMSCNIEFLRKYASLYPNCTIKEFIEVYTSAVKKLNK